ncbi:DUF1761 domain-containing protein [Actinoplanes utahensis]|uniref:DUF1761 domain-containing protein n=1 Tax=Actinoplanes utahensis TaxID=1869 RepID=A0A0A6UPJ5_ACTUT|nr:DUF1761 domain-containing protein [Actinoplanes utahensis]KHD77351.1 hypothetical protein MB27_11350 [Actinoplanes utahensis]GIF32906.1 hypothetical protein Aut01nite_58920 [Actinoplanes utahensis]
MFDVLADLHWFGILAGFLALTLLGGLWFAALFPRAYHRSLGREPGAKAPSTPLFLAGPAATSLTITLTSAVLMAALKIDTYGDALLFGLIVGAGYLAANTLTIAINPNFPRPLLYATISGGYNIVGSLLVSAILQTL